MSNIASHFFFFFFFFFFLNLCEIYSVSIDRNCMLYDASG